MSSNLATPGAINSAGLEDGASLVKFAVGGAQLQSYTIAGLPAATPAGRIVFVSNANSGAGTVAVSNGTIWVDVKTGVAPVTGD